MPIVQRTDNNGKTYYTVTPAEWQGDYGVRLREMSWRYCGYGTYGIIIAQGSNACFLGSNDADIRSDPGPFIGPTTPPPDVSTPPDSLTLSGGVTDKACGTCRKTSSQQIQLPGAQAPTPGARPAPIPSRAGWPWWLVVLAALTLAQIVHGRNT